MKLSNKKVNISSIHVYSYLAVYFGISLLMLTSFPAMHSDESWLSALTRTMMHSGLGATEYFFDLVPRYPHAIKSIFHIVQMPFILVFGYSLFAARLVSLVFAIVALWVVYRLVRHLTKSTSVSLLAMIILSVDIQMVYASHMARQEIVIVTLMLIGIYYIVSRCEGEWSTRNDLMVAGIIGISIGVHPNSFILALVMGSVYLYYIFIDRKMNLKNLVLLMLFTVLFATIFVGLSFLMDCDFIGNYIKYGDAAGATNSGIMKIFKYPSYYRKLYNGFSVTYYLPLIKGQLIVFGISVVVGLACSIFGRRPARELMPILAIVAVNVGYIAIGRYSQPGIVLVFPLGYLLIYMIVSRLPKYREIVLALVALVSVTYTIWGIVPDINSDYSEYIDTIQESIPREAVVLANLNAEYAFEYDVMYDYRNLDMLDGMTFARYIEQNNIEYIVYPQEIDFIYDNRPTWNVLYGNVYPYYDQMQSYLDEQCLLVDEFTSPYAMRILMYAYDREWKVKIYKVDGAGR